MSYYEDESVTLHHGDALAVAGELPSGSVDCIVTSPPYFGLRDYGIEGQYGLEESPAAYVETMRALFAELRRVLTDDGTLWLNIGDSYSTPVMHNDNAHNANRVGGSDAKARAMGDAMGRVKRTMHLPAKNLLGIPWRVAFALQDDGWILRNAIVWNKPNAMPESVTDRLSTRYEMVFMFSKSRKYWFDLDSIREPQSKATEARMKSGPVGIRRDQSPDDERGAHLVHGLSKGRNPGDVWSIPTHPFAAAHFAVMALSLAERCVQAGCKPNGTVLDPFSGSGTTGLAAAKHGRKYVGIDLNAEYLDLSLKTRLASATLGFSEVSQ